MLWQNVEHFVVATDTVRTGTLEDLKGLGGKFAVGSRNSGAMESTRMIMEALDVARGRDLTFAYLSYNAAADALQNGTIKGFSAPAGAPVSAVARAYAAIGDDMSVLNITNDELAKIDEGVGLWTRFEIPAGTYPGQTEAIVTAAQPNFLAVNADVDAEVVYEVTRVIFENLPFLYSVHQATRGMALETAVGGLPVPLHAGAARYFLEQGLEIPPHLLPEDFVYLPPESASP